MSTKILTINEIPTMNFSYVRTFRKLIKNMDKRFEWFYGGLGYNGPTVDYDFCKLLPVKTNATKFPLNIGDIMNAIKPDVLVMHNDPQWVKWINNPSISNIPKVMWYPHDNENPMSPNLKNIVKNFNLIVTVAKFAQQILLREGIPSYQIYNPIDTVNYKPITEEQNLSNVKRSYNFKNPEEHKFISWLGAPGWRKRLMHVVEIFRRVKEQVPNVHLLIHSDFKELNYEVKELFHMADLKINEDVFYPPKMPLQGMSKEIVNAFYNMTDVYIAPHGGEGMCLPICEAMATETPFVATDYTTTAEFAGYDRNKTLKGSRGFGAKVNAMIMDKGIPRPYVDLDDAAEKVVYLLEHKKEAKQMGKNGRKWVVENASSHVVAKKWEHLLDKVTKVNELVIK